MEIIAGTIDFELEQPTAVAIGKFDGVHLGHRRLLDEILEQKKNGLSSCVFTFDPAPSVLFGYSDGKELTTIQEKRAILEKIGVDILIEFPLNYETAAIEPKDFVRDVLCGQMQMAYLAAGVDISFGARGAGDGKLLQSMASELDYHVKLIDKVAVDGREVSSTYIRECVEMSQMEQAERLLGIPYTVSGEVVYGNQIGRTLGFPTVNLTPPESKLMPPNGVYYSEVICDGNRYNAISNVGTKPTVSDKPQLGLETYLYDFSKDAYGEYIEVRLLGFKRPEQRFANLEALKAQLARDIEDGRKWHDGKINH